MKRLMACVAALWAFGAWASVSEVHEFEPANGRSGEMYKAAMEAEAIQTKLGGATVWFGTDLTTGNLQYSLTFPDWSAWAAFGAKLQASKEWAAFITKYDVANPASTQVAVAFLDTPVVAKTQPVGMVYLWKIAPGKFDAFMAIAQQAVTIHNGLGASAGINIDDMNNVAYEMTFDSWASWAKFVPALQKSEAWAALLKKANEDPSGELVRVMRLEQFKKP